MTGPGENESGGERRGPHGAGNKLARVAWGACYWTLFRPSPRPLWGWRRLLLKLFGADVAAGAKVVQSAKIWLPANLSLGPRGVPGGGRGLL